MADADISLHALARVAITVEPWHWPLAAARRDEIAAHFADVRRRQPRIWNGRVLLSRDVVVQGAVLRGRAFETDFADFLWWRDRISEDGGLRNVFAMAALRGRDGAFLLGVMADHTANAGRVYFPAGTPGPEDVDEGRIDFEGSMARELTEETGLSAATFDAEPGWTAVCDGRRIALVRVLQSREAGETLVARVRTHIAADPGSELAGVALVAHRRDLVAAMPPFVRAYLMHMLPA